MSVFPVTTAKLPMLSVKPTAGLQITNRKRWKMKRVMQLAIEYQLAKQHKAGADAAAGEAGARVRAIEQELAAAMISLEVSKFTSDDGWTFAVDPKTFVSPETGCTDAVVSWIVNNGGAALMSIPRMHHAKRDSFLRDVLLDDDGCAELPEELQGLIRVHTEPRVSMTAAR
jgi:hypothetical protein